jgi:hypothetical protein
LGDTSDSLKKVVDEEVKKCVAGKSLKKCIFTCKFEGIECKIGNKPYPISKISDNLLSKKKRKKIDDNVYGLE